MHLPSWTRKGAAKAHGLQACAVALLAASMTLTAPAGGYLSFAGGVVDTWSGTVTVNLDLGGLGSLSNAAADTLTLDALNTWDLATVSLTFAQGTDLASDQTGANTTIFTTAGDGISPIAYDTDGSLTDAILGAGANQSVLGFAGPQAFSGNTITEGRAALNGLFINGINNPGGGDPNDVSSLQFQGVIAHEFGHMLNLDHAQHNAAFAQALTPGSLDPRDFTGFPTMYPLVHADIDTLANDDTQWISSLYPTAGFTSGTATFTGIVRNSGGTATNGVNVVCRQVDDPRNSVISCVSGYFSGGTLGEFMIPGLVPGEAYVLDVEQIRSSFVAGSRVGPLGSQLSFGTVGLPEFINRAGDEGAGDALSSSSTFIAPAGGANTNLPDLTLNGAPSLSTPVAEVDPGASLAGADWDDITSDLTTAVMAGQILRISGSAADGSESGDVDFGSGDIDDYYLIDANTAGFPLEVFDIVVTPSGGAVDLYVLSWDLAGGGQISATSSTTGGVGVAESIDRFWDPSRFGSGAVDGFMLIGVGGDGGVTTSYTLDIMATHLDTQDGGAVYVGGVSTNGGVLHVNGTDTNSITGQGFSSAGGGPIVTTDDPNITVGPVTFISSQQVDVVLSDAGSFAPGDVVLTVTNAAAGGGASGDIEMINTAVPVELSVFQAE